jgi:L-ribulose-5-phosphate 3-epimerase
VGIEGVHFHVINTPTKMKRLVDDLNSPNVRVIFDPVNYINTANYKNQDEIINTHFDLLGEKTKLLHLKDFKLVDGEVAYEFYCCDKTAREIAERRGIKLIKICFGIS